VVSNDPYHIVLQSLYNVSWSTLWIWFSMHELIEAVAL
jgi:hypothetical protein